MNMQNDAENIQLQMQWVGDMVSPPAIVNQFMLQAGPNTLDGRTDTHHLTVGYVTPPFLVPEMPPEALEALASQPVPVLPLGRFVLTEPRLVDLYTIIGNHLRQVGAIN